MGRAEHGPGLPPPYWSQFDADRACVKCFFGQLKRVFPILCDDAHRISCYFLEPAIALASLCSTRDSGIVGTHLSGHPLVPSGQFRSRLSPASGDGTASLPSRAAGLRGKLVPPWEWRAYRHVAVPMGMADCDQERSQGTGGRWLAVHVGAIVACCNCTSSSGRLRPAQHHQ